MRSTDREADAPGWQARVVPNLYPAYERQEVVVHSPRHARSIAELEPGELEPVAAAWEHRIAAARTEGFAYVHVLINEGREAGASLPHTHSQLIWLPEAPPAATREYPNLEPRRCALCALLAEAGALELAADGDLRLLVHPAGRSPYELLVAGLEHRPEGDAELFAGALRLLRAALLRVRGVEGPVPLNAWTHAGAHWHLEIVPRLTVLAGLELGAELYVNSLPPEEAAAALRV